MSSCRCDAVNMAYKLSQFIQRLFSQQNNYKEVHICILDASECHRRSKCKVSGAFVQCCNEIKVSCNGQYDIGDKYPDLLVVVVKNPLGRRCSKRCIVAEIKLCISKAMTIGEKEVRRIIEKIENLRTKYSAMSCGNYEEVLVVPSKLRNRMPSKLAIFGNKEIKINVVSEDGLLDKLKNTIC